MERTLLQNLIGVIFLYRWRLLGAALLILFANILLVLNPLLLRYVIGQGNAEPVKFAALFVGIAFFSAALRYYMRIEFNKVSREVEREFRAKLFRRIQAQSMSFYDRHGVGELIQRLSGDVNAYRDVVGPGLIFPTSLLTTVIPGLFALFYISPLMGFLTLIPLLMIPFFNLAARKQLYKASGATQEKMAEMSGFVQEDYNGIREIKSYSAEPFLLERFKILCREFFGLNFRLMCYQGWFFPLLMAFVRLVTLLLVLLAGLFVLSPADFVSFMWIQSYIFFPMVIMGWVIPIWQRGRAAYERLLTLYEEPIEVTGSTEGLKVFPPQADLQFKDLTFSYPGQKALFEGLNLTIPEGTLVALVGPPGSGKTTLLKLLCREYEVPEGALFIGSHEVHEYALSAFWQEIVVVEQAPFLFSRSVRDNVSFGKPEATEEEIRQACEASGLHDEVIGFEKGYDTLVGERGVTLSGGQKCRLAIARALLVKRSILLFDDIFASLDNKTALKIFEAITRLNRTVVICTSKVNLLERMDKLVFLIEGKVVEEGSPDELSQIKGHWTALKELEALVEPE